MTDTDKQIETGAVSIAIIGTGTGDGGGVAPTPNGTVAKTPEGQPNLLVQVVAPTTAIVVRFVNLYLTVLVGLLAAGMTPEGGKLLYTSDFWHLCVRCASLALPGAAVGFVKDVITVFGRLEGKYPLGTGSI